MRFQVAAAEGESHSRLTLPQDAKCSACSLTVLTAARPMLGERGKFAQFEREVLRWARGLSCLVLGPWEVLASVTSAGLFTRSASL